MAWNAWKRCCKKVDSQGGHFTGIHDRFSEIQFIVNHNSQSDGQNKSAKSLDDHTYRLTPEEKRRYKGQWYLTLNKEGKNRPMKLRSDYRTAVIMKNRLQHESGEPIE